MTKIQPSKTNSKDTNTMKYYNFYSKYLTISSDVTGESANTLQAPSPFGNGVLEIASNGTFSCKMSGKTGNPADFIKALYPSVSDLGAKLIATEDNRLRHRQLTQADDLIQAFRIDEPLVRVAASKIGLRPAQLKEMPVFMDKRGFRYHYVTDCSPTGSPLAVASFSPGRALRNIQGVTRPPEETSQRVWLTENPVIAYQIKEHTGDTAFCWPKQRELEIFDYKALLAGKDVVALHGELTFTYEESFYPAFEMLRRSVQSFADLRYEVLCKGEHFASWIEKQKNQELLFMQAQVSQDLQPITKAHYEKYIRMDDVVDVQFGQSSARGYFFYGTGEDLIAQSWPLSLDGVKQTETNYRLRFIRPTRFHNNIKLTPDRVLSIGQSVTQFTPRNTLNMVRGFISDHIYFENKEKETLLGLWIMGTYAFSLFNAYPYLHINAPLGSGKTTVIELIEKSAFNSIKTSKVTTANLMHTISDTQCTMCLDEFENTESAKRASLIQILNSGYKKGGNYRRLRGSNTDSMNLYCPKVYASIQAIGTDSLASRTLRIDMQRKPKFESLLPWSDDDVRINKRASEIMSGGYAIGLYHHRTIEMLQAKLGSQISLPSGITVDGRDRELIAPLIIMAQLVDIHREEGDISVEAELYRALEAILFPEMEEELQRIKILTNQLREWSETPDQVIFKIKGEYCWISNKMWENSRLLTHFEGENNDLINWLKSLSDAVRRENEYIAEHGNQSCTVFPLNLTLNSKEFREWFSPETASEAA